LNEILRRMGDVVSSQGDIINRIDENLIDAHGHVKKGRDQLMERAGRE
jgi:t-SNARE complex subunit (syntaxin)